MNIVKKAGWTFCGVNIDLSGILALQTSLEEKFGSKSTSHWKLWNGIKPKFHDSKRILQNTYEHDFMNFFSVTSKQNDTLLWRIHGRKNFTWPSHIWDCLFRAQVTDFTTHRILICKAFQRFSSISFIWLCKKFTLISRNTCSGIIAFGIGRWISFTATKSSVARSRIKYVSPERPKTSFQVQLKSSQEHGP